ncbi:MAG: tetratricopeptide repeat protein [PVC group bacterium]
MRGGEQRANATPVLLAGVIVIAALVRAAYLIELSSTPFFRHPVLDAQYYLSWGSSLARSGFHFFPEYQGNPLYPYFLAFLIRFLHAGPLALRIVQHGLGVVTCLLIFRAGKCLFSVKTGLLAAFFYAIYTPAVFYEGWFLSASLTAFLAAALLSSLLSAAAGRRPGQWLGGGIIGGMLTLARPTLLPLGALAWILISFWGRGAERRNASLLFLSGILIVVIPVSLYLSLSRRELVFVSSHGGENFYIGNNPAATGVSRIPDFARGTPSLQHNDFQREAERRAGRPLSPSESSRFWFREGRRFAVSRPLLFLGLLVRKTALFFSAGSFSDNYHLPFFRDQLPILRLPFSWHVLSAGGILGMVTGWKERKRLGLLYLLTAGYAASIALFFIADRFRLPAAPFFALFAAGAVSFLFRSIRRKQTRTATGIILAGVFLFIGTGLVPEAVPSSASHLSAGEVYYRDGQYHRAVDYLKKARADLETAPAPAIPIGYRIQYALGQAYLGEGELEKAQAGFRQLKSEHRSGRQEPDFEIGNAYAEHCLYRQAREHYLAAVSEKPDHHRAWNNLGMVYREEGEAGKARTAFLTALDLQPEYAPAHTNLGNLLVREEQFEAALNEFKEALRIDPSLARIHLSAAFCLQKLNRLSEAEEELRRCPPAFRKEH